jgi:alkanesulfonate monooxygenase SsuD/methylene tetrahydromethanopterin reductase-like flavin-dependent oxidoreductase (luciferase family)
MTTDTDRERVIDARVQRRLATDHAYRNAENADDQARREDEITAEEEQRFEQPTVAEVIAGDIDQRAELLEKFGAAAG